MSEEVLVHTAPAGEDLTAASGLAVYQDPADSYRIKLCDDQTKALNFVGILDVGGETGEMVTFVYSGEHPKAFLDGAGTNIPGGAVDLTVNASAKFVLAVPTNVVVGKYVPEKPNAAGDAFIGVTVDNERGKVNVNDLRLVKP